VKNHKVTYVAGGAAQNAARGAAYILPPKSVVFTGCVGDDNLAEQLKAANKREGLDEVYFVKKGEKTGACAVIITGHHRSLVTTLRVAEKFDKSHLWSPEVAPLIDAAKVFYVEGYFLSHGFETVLELAKKVAEKKKTFVLNLSAPFIPQFFSSQLHQLYPYTDVLIGNETEAETWSRANGLPYGKEELDQIAKAIAVSPKVNNSRDRIVVLTQGSGSTIVVTSSDNNNPRTYPVNLIKDEDIVDTNGAGDAFAGGFLAGLVSEKNIDECIEAGHKMGAMCVREVGPQYKWPKVSIL